METYSAKEFAQRLGLTDTHMLRILEHPDRYPRGMYEIADAWKVGRRWKITAMERPAAVAARGSAELLDGIVRLASRFEQAYSMREVVDDLRTRPVAEVAGNLVRRLPSLTEVVQRAAEIARTAPAPPEVLLRAKPYFSQ